MWETGCSNVAEPTCMNGAPDTRHGCRAVATQSPQRQATRAHDLTFLNVPNMQLPIAVPSCQAASMPVPVQCCNLWLVTAHTDVLTPKKFTRVLFLGTSSQTDLASPGQESLQASPRVIMSKMEIEPSKQPTASHHPFMSHTMMFDMQQFYSEVTSIRIRQHQQP